MLFTLLTRVEHLGDIWFVGPFRCGCCYHCHRAHRGTLRLYLNANPSVAKPTLPLTTTAIFVVERHACEISQPAMRTVRPVLFSRVCSWDTMAGLLRRSTYWHAAADAWLVQADVLVDPAEHGRTTELLSSLRTKYQVNVVSAENRLSKIVFPPTWGSAGNCGPQPIPVITLRHSAMSASWFSTRDTALRSNRMLMS